LNTLLADNSVSVILLGADITGNVTINRSVTIDGKGNKINGDVTINNTDQNDVTLKDVTITGKTILN
jgi:cytoskeletal protein CcmA (bactofilin family)